MTETPTEARLEDLEIRFAHQEAALEELTLDRLAQARRIEQLEDKIEQLERTLRAMEANVPDTNPVGNERPPHY